ncbi:MAG: membrane lipoprotein lipid attachment site-containing protein [bacterium]|nr:membrane lipoprotein lipid attachment site-containing protein [bacterium]
MKKILLVFVAILLLSGCSLSNMDNTPTKKVENYLNEYQTLGSNVLSKLDSVVDQEVLFDEDQKTTYRDILKKHYQDLTYTIKEETINGDKATVEAEIEVNDYTKVLKEIESYKTTNNQEFLDDNGSFDDIKFNNYKLNLLKSNKDRVKYTIYFSLTKIEDEWTLDSLTDTEESKLLGIYEY